METNDSMVPPVLSFSLPQFKNPRTMDYTGQFGITIYSASNQEIYTWDPTAAITVNGVTSTAVTSGPVIRMSTAASPQAITVEPLSS